MSDEENPTLLTAEQLIQRIENEGLAYAVTCYYGRNIKCTDDPKMEALWKKAYDAIDELEKHVFQLKS
jgi:hypothetical protein